MKFNTTVRLAQADDIKYLVDLDVKCFEHAWLPDEWKSAWEKKEIAIYVSSIYNTPVGMMVLEEQKYEEKSLLHIYKLAVHKLHRNKRVGKEMLACAFDIALKANDDYLSISVPESLTDPSNPANCLDWLHKMGFRSHKIEGKERLYGREEDVFLFLLSVK